MRIIKFCTKMLVQSFEYLKQTSSRIFNEKSLRVFKMLAKILKDLANILEDLVQLLRIFKDLWRS